MTTLLLERVRAARRGDSTALVSAALGLFVFAVAAVYWRVFARLAQDWMNDGNYSHGFLVVPLAAYFVWERRARLATTPVRPRWAGLAIIVAGLCVLIAGLLGAELFVTRVSLLIVLAGAVVFVLGWSHLRLVAFPLAFLLLMIPIPAIVFNQVAFPLQLLASALGTRMLSAVSIPVLREGNVIVLASTSLEVAEACSGIRSLASLLTIGIVYGYVLDRRAPVRLLIAAATIPIAIVSNALRVAATGVAAHHFGRAAAEGFFHTSSGWLAFVPALLLLVAFAKLLQAVVPKPVEVRGAA